VDCDDLDLAAALDRRLGRRGKDLDGSVVGEAHGAARTGADADGDDGVPPDELDEARLNGYMALAHTPDPDLFIRTGGEVRISNFLLWQAAYSELVFTDCLWPEFGVAELDSALAEYARRDRRFGGVKDSVPEARRA